MKAAFFHTISAILVLLTLEAGLRLAAFVVRRHSESVTHRAPNGRNSTVIVVMGESTTEFGGENSYPRALERALNIGNKGYFVWNEGAAASTTLELTRRLPKILQETKPDFVIFMMGINDDWALKHVMGKSAIRLSLESRLGEFRLLKFLDLVKINLSAQLSREKQNRLENVREFIEAVEREDPKESCSKAALKEWHEARALRAVDPILATIRYREIDKVHSGMPASFYFQFAELLIGQAKKSESESAIRKALQIRGSANDYIVALLMTAGPNLSKTEECNFQFTKIALDRDPKNANALYLMGRCLLGSKNQTDQLLAEKLFRQANAINPHSSIAVLALAEIEEIRGNLGGAEVLLREVDARDDFGSRLAFLELNRLLKKEGKLDSLKELDSSHIERTGIRYWEIPETMQNYQAAIHLVQHYGAIPIVLQYPMLPIQPLRERLHGDNLRFISLELPFSKYVEKEGNGSIFKDRFAKVFGHFTERGAAIWGSLLASEIQKMEYAK